MNTRLTVLSLYRTKVRICHELGYKYGNIKTRKRYRLGNINMNSFIYIYGFINKRNRKECGTGLMNTVRETYKSYKNIDVNTEEGKEMTNELVDKGFEYLKDLNYITHAINMKKR